MAQWYYGDNGQQVGPMDDGAIHAAINEGKVGLNTLVWREGMPSWLPMFNVPELTGQVVPAVGYPPNAAPSPYASPQMPYAPYPGYYPQNTTSNMAISSLVCGILGFTCLPIFGIPAVICGHMAMKQISESALPMGGRGMAIAGLITGYISIVICLVTIFWIIFMVASQ